MTAGIALAVAGGRGQNADMTGARFMKRVDGPGGVWIHSVDLRPDEAVEAACLALLAPDERARAERFKVDRPRRQFVITRGALRLLLADHIDRPPRSLTFAAGPHGKPFLVVDGTPSSVRFNVSHSAARALIAIAPVTVGIDIEILERQADLELIARGVFTEPERAALAAEQGAEQARLFFRLWTVKEALIKARGSGFAYPPARFEVPEALRSGAAQARFSFPGEPTPVWHITDLSEDGYAAALAQEEPG